MWANNTSLTTWLWGSTLKVTHFFDLWIWPIADFLGRLKYVRAEFVKFSTIYIAVGDTFEPL